LPKSFDIPVSSIFVLPLTNRESKMEKTGAFAHQNKILNDFRRSQSAALSSLLVILKNHDCFIPVFSF
jgi:hypothetical protein